MADKAITNHATPSKETPPIMHTKASSSPCGVKKIYVPRQDAATLAIHAIACLNKMLHDNPIAGVRLWQEIDVEVEMVTYHCEVAGRQTISTNLNYCLMEAAGEMPTKQCGGRCGLVKSINAFPHLARSTDGHSTVCHSCNRMNASLGARKSG